MNPKEMVCNAKSPAFDVDRVILSDVRNAVKHSSRALFGVRSVGMTIIETCLTVSIIASLAVASLQAVPTIMNQVKVIQQIQCNTQKEAASIIAMADGVSLEHAMAEWATACGVDVSLSPEALQLIDQGLLSLTEVNK
jgi:type II secretory pathway pseudopilin PulG